MFKIGDFSKLSQVTVKTLRYYDELGLLKPAHIDRFTSYRFYSADQLPRLNRILVLKDLGFPLEQIGRLLDADVSPEQIRGMLQLRQAELQQHIETEQARLARVEARLRHVDKEHIMPAYDVVIKKIEPQMVATLRRVIPTYSHTGELFEELFNNLGSTRPVGPALSIEHDPEYRERDVDVEAAVPVNAAQVSGTGVTVRELEGVETMACVIHQGPYDTITQVYEYLMEWFESNGYRISGPNRQVYLREPGPQVDPSEYVTEVQVPVERAA
jgi:effector-binding domain-containing protein